MNIKPFLVEEWMNEYEMGATYNIAETCVDSMSLEELYEVLGEDLEKFLSDFSKKRLTYGYIEGNPLLLQGISKLYKTLDRENIITTHGAIGANHHVFFSLIEPGDEVISIMPTYQQLYSIPEAYGANVRILNLKPENNYIPDLNELSALITENTKMICINNPNNPTGALIPNYLLEEIVELAKTVEAYVLCDEVYRHLAQEYDYQNSIADIYDKGISVSGMSKVFSLAGIRLGWIGTKNDDAIAAFKSHRDYNTISCSMFDEEIGAVALSGAEKILERNREIVRKNLGILDTWMSEQEHLSYVKPEAGTTALIHYDFDIPAYEFCERLLKETGAFVTPGDAFGLHKSFRIGYACDENELRKGLKAMGDFLNTL